MAKFRFVLWLLEFLQSHAEFIFDWDEGNSTKSASKHGVDNHMVESSFRDTNLLALGEQYQPKVDESRYGMIGRAETGQILFVCFTIRENRIRPISSRSVNQIEKELYEKAIC
jgi:uncharacterized DUF497 family protein